MSSGFCIGDHNPNAQEPRESTEQLNPILTSHFILYRLLKAAVNPFSEFNQEDPKL